MTTQHTKMRSYKCVDDAKLVRSFPSCYFESNSKLIVMGIIWELIHYTERLRTVHSLSHCLLVRSAYSRIYSNSFHLSKNVVNLRKKEMNAWYFLLVLFLLKVERFRRANVCALWVVFIFVMCLCITAGILMKAWWTISRN